MAPIALTALALLVVAWIGYPLLLSLVAIRGGHRGETGVFEPSTVTVVIATRERPWEIHARVCDILKANYPAALLEVIVAVDARSKYDLADYTCKLRGLARVVRGDLPGGKAAALNAGVRASTGETLIFADSYQTFDPDVIINLSRSLVDLRYGAVSGMVEQRSGDALMDLYWKSEQWLRRGQAAIHSVVSTSGQIQAVRRSLWIPLPTALICDDLFTTMQLVMRGYRVGYCEAARASDSRHFTRRQHFDRKVRTLTGLVQLVAWMPAVLVPWKNPMSIHLWCHKIVRLLTPYLVLLVFVGVLSAIGSLPRDVLWISGAILTVSVTATALALPKRTGRVLTQLAWALMLLAAPILALRNGLQGRWDVWAQHAPVTSACESG